MTRRCRRPSSRCRAPATSPPPPCADATRSRSRSRNKNRARTRSDEKARRVSDSPGLFVFGRNYALPGAAVGSERGLGLIQRGLADRGQRALGLRVRGQVPPGLAPGLDGGLEGRLLRRGNLAGDARLVLRDEVVALGHADLLAGRGGAGG